jgi:polyhydroxybutyrate depolymerase
MPALRVTPPGKKDKPWGEHCTLYPSKGGTPVVTYIHSGGHQLPDDVPPVIVKFFKQQAKP